MAGVQAVHLDLDAVLEILSKGVRRADVFMGMGLNAAEQTPPPSHILAAEKGHEIHLVKQNLDENETAHVAAEFGKWVRANGLRELMETFSIFLNQLFAANYLRLSSTQKLGDLIRMPPGRFDRMGIGDQIEALAEAVDVSDEDIRVVRSLNQARNCYAHRRGLVGQNDVCAKTGIFELMWTVIRFEVVEPDGNIVSESEMYGRVLTNGGKFQMRVAMQERQFKLGAELVLTKQELKEICLCVLSIGSRLFNETVECAKLDGLLAGNINTNPEEPKPV